MTPTDLRLPTCGYPTKVTRFVQHWDTYSNENCPNNTQNLPKQIPNFEKYSISPQKWQQTFKILPQWQNFAKSGHTGVYVD